LERRLKQTMLSLISDASDGLSKDFVISSAWTCLE
jgi:hypothetical protein